MKQSSLIIFLLLTSCASQTRQNCDELEGYLVDSFSACIGHIDSSPSECVESSKELLCKIELTVEE